MFSLAFKAMLPPQMKQMFHSLRSHIVLNYITLHYIYYIVVCLVAAIILWASSTPAWSLSFVDSLFLAISAMTQAGLNTVNLSLLNTWQQFVLFFLMLIGSSVLISSAVVHARKKAFEARFAHILKNDRPRRKAARSRMSTAFPRMLSPRRVEETNADEHTNESTIVQGQLSSSRTNGGSDNEKGERGNPRGNQALGYDPIRPQIGDEEQETPEKLQDAPDLASNSEQHVKISQMPPYGGPSLYTPALAPVLIVQQDLSLTNDAVYSPPPDRCQASEEIREDPRSTSRYFESRGSIGRNSQFHSLSLTERERLGGVEYKAVNILEKIIICYYILWQLLGCLGLGAWIANYQASTTLSNGENPWWVGAFLGVSAFNNNGMSLLDENMIPFQPSYYVLITMALLILAGNTCFPVFLRLILWLLLKLLPDSQYSGGHRRTLQFLLDHPRRCYTHLFPSHHTWWLLGSLILLNGIDWAAFEVLNLGNEAIYTSKNALPVLDGLFQAVAVRSGGFYVVPIAELSIGLLVLYVLMMYISVYPVTITIRNSNVYEERSLGIYSDDPEIGPQQKQSWLSAMYAKLRDPNKEGSRAYFVRQQLRGQLAHDLWWLSLAVLFITIIESRQFKADPVTFAVFNIVFETVSAYGCVGISTGAPNVNFSFCGTWHSLSKLILCAVMLRGRHRGLPVTIDQAVLLPGEHLGVAEEEDAAVRRDITHERRIGRRGDNDVLASSNA